MRVYHIVPFVLLIGMGCLGRFTSGKYKAETKNQKVPAEILNTTWLIESYNGKTPVCQTSISFHPKGELAINWGGRSIYDHYVFYNTTDSTVALHLGKTYKFAWDSGECEAAPDNLTFMSWRGPWKIDIHNDRWKVAIPGYPDKPAELILVKITHIPRR